MSSTMGPPKKETKAAISDTSKLSEGFAISVCHKGLKFLLVDIWIDCLFPEDVDIFLPLRASHSNIRERQRRAM